MEDNQNDIPDVAPFKPLANPVRIQKQTPEPIKEVVTFRPILAAAPPLASLHQDINPYGVSGPYIGNAYLPPNHDYLPPVGSVVPAGASFTSQDFQPAPPSLSIAESSSVFQYV